MPYFTYDTSVLISRKLTNLQVMPQGFLLSAIVLMEIIAGAEDKSDRKFYEQVFRQYQRNNLLIVPNDEDWLLASENSFSLNPRQKTLAKRKTKAARSWSFTAPGP